MRAPRAYGHHAERHLGGLIAAPNPRTLRLLETLKQTLSRALNGVCDADRVV